MQHTTQTIPKIDIAELLAQLLSQGVSYRYKPERFAVLKGGGHPFASPTTVVSTPTGSMIEEAIQPVLTPIVLSQKQSRELDALAAAWPLFNKVQMDIYHQARAGNLAESAVAIIRSLCTQEEWKYGAIEPGYRTIHPFIRLDAILTPGGFKVMDINSTRPAGVGDLITATELLAPYSAGTYPYKTGKIFTRNVQRCIDQWSAHQKLPGESVRTKIVIRTDDGDWHNFDRIRQALQSNGLECSLVTPDQLTNGDPTAIIRGRIKEGDPAYDLLKEGYPEKRCILSPLYRRFLGNKVWMYLFRIEPFRSIFINKLGQPTYDILDTAFADIGIVHEDYIQMPHTRQPLRTADKNSWVVKDPTSSSGRRMLLGYTMTQRRWMEELWNNVEEGWIAQRFYTNVQELCVAGPQGQPMSTKLFTKYGIFIFSSSIGGLEFHSRTHPVVHGARNAYFNPVFIQDA